LGSSNGTFVDDERLGPEDQVVLHPGDLIRIGSTYVVFEEPPPPATDHPGFSHDEEDLDAATEISIEADDDGDVDTAEMDIHYPVLTALAKACSASPDVPTLIDRICNIALSATPADAIYVFLRSEGALKPVAHKRRGKKERELKISTTIIKRALQRSRSLLVSDAQSDKRFSDSASVVIEGIRSVICAPLAAQKRMDGALYLHSATFGKTFTDDHLRLVTAIALQTGVAIEALEAQEKSRQQLLSVFRAVVRAHEQASSWALRGHSDRTRACARSLCRVLDLPVDEARVVELAALLHSIGRLSAPDGAFERVENRYDSATLGAELLRRMGMDEVATVVEAHMERLDGSGGPRALIGHQIPKAALIVGLAEQFDRLLSTSTTGTTGHAALQEVMAQILHGGKNRFGADMVRALAKAVRVQTGEV
ncbi:GAF domain-containing protein, partial [bacterium]|nr:GAF domain-containing protein [bacterium]